MAKVLEEKMFVAVDPAENHNKFWKYERFDTPISAPGKRGVMETGDVRYTWGRIGAGKPQSTLKMFNEKELARIIRDKLNKSDQIPYQEIQVLNSNGASVPPKQLQKEEIKRAAVKEIAGDCNITGALIKKLAEVNRHELNVATGGKIDVDLETGIVRTALGVVSLETVQTARQKLDLIAPYINRGDFENKAFHQLLADYLRLIPQVVGHKRGWYRDFNLTNQTSLLDQLESSIELANKRIDDGRKAAVKNGKAETNGTFRTRMKVVTDNKVIERVKKLYSDNVNRGHSCSHLRPVRVYEVEIPHMAEAFEIRGRKVGNIKTLWHGSRAFNILSILSRGFVLPTQLSTVQTTGAMFDNGVYFSNQSTKSLNYSYGYWGGGGRESNCYMFLVDVAMGKEYIPSGSDSRAASKCKSGGYDSCHAMPGRSGVMNDEQIIYDPAQSNIKYLVEFDS